MKKIVVKSCGGCQENNICSLYYGDNDFTKDYSNFIEKNCPLEDDRTEELEAEIARLRAERDSWSGLCTEKQAEIDRLEAQLPSGMEHCTIRFVKCEKGHGRLTATNWIDNGCQACEIDVIKAQLAELREAVAHHLAMARMASGNLATNMDRELYSCSLLTLRKRLAEVE